MERSSYNRIEQGHSSARIDSLLLITDAIGVPLAELVRQAGGPQEVGSADLRRTGVYWLPQHSHGTATGPLGVAITTKPRPGQPRAC
jgi:transcriptional regulator with XRE-family HTH domain